MTIVAQLYKPGVMGRGWTSTTTFVADAKGVVDAAKMAPLRGSYTGVDPDGFFWSMTEAPLAEGLGLDRKAAFVKAKVGAQVVA